MIGARRYFAPRMFAPRYWPKTGAAAAVGQFIQRLLLLGVR